MLIFLANKRLLAGTIYITILIYLLEVLIERGSAAVSGDANRTKTVCRTVEHMNFFLVKLVT